MIVCGLAVTLASCKTTGSAGQTAPPGASFVFLGTVTEERPGGTEIPGRVVHVDRVYFQRGAFDDQTGSEVIVSGEKVPSSGQHVFHVDPYQFGRRIAASLVLAEPGREFTEGDVKKLERTKRKEELQERVDGAELIFVGSVASTRAWGRGDVAESEHDPQFTLATVTVREILRGRIESGRVEFLFAASDDVHWYRSPKPRQGLEALFLLRRGFKGAVAGVAEQWTLLHENDLLEKDDVEIVRENLRK